jgi:two-component system, cell cycle response regulator DivK
MSASRTSDRTGLGPIMIKHPPVLLVSGDADSAEMYAVGLSLAGFRPLVATDAVSLQSCLGSERPQAVVVDFTDRRDSNWQLQRDIRSRADARDTPVVLLANELNASTRARAEALGSASVLLKPCLPDALVDAVRGAIQMRPGVAPSTSNDR